MCLLRGTDCIVIYNSTFCRHSVFMCFVWIWEQTAIISLYSINWLVWITETECVYCAVRTGSLYIIQVMCFVWIWEQTAIISIYSVNWLVCITETESVYCAVRTGSLYIIQVIWFVWIWEQTAIISQCSINWLEMEFVLLNVWTNVYTLFNVLQASNTTFWRSAVKQAKKQHIPTAHKRIHLRSW